MKRWGRVALVLAGFVGGIVFVYSCGGGSSSQSEDKLWPSPAAVTGQVVSYATGDDGDIGAGLAWPDPRFTDNNDGTVTDNLTGLVWLQTVAGLPSSSWSEALVLCNNLHASTGTNPTLGLTDGSLAGDWRLANVRELLSLVDYGQNSPSLPSGHPFPGVQAGIYHTSSTMNLDTGKSWHVNLNTGYSFLGNKTDSYYLWCVRDAL